MSEEQGIVPTPPLPVLSRSKHCRSFLFWDLVGDFLSMHGVDGVETSGSEA